MTVSAFEARAHGGLAATAVVVAHDGGEDLLRCVGALLQSSHVALDVLVVDNGSCDGACARLQAQRDARVRVLRLERNRGFAGGVNAGIARLERELTAGERAYVLVNQDCFVRPGAVAALVSRLEADPAIAVVGARILEPDGRTLVHAGGAIRPNGLTEHVGRGLRGDAACSDPADVEYVTGALCALRAAAWRLLGPFDERYRPLYFEEVDFCVRARRAGLRVVYEPASVALHVEAGCSGGAASALYLRRYHRSRMRFVAQHRLTRGAWAETVAAEARWLVAQRRLADVAPALRAYLALPYELVTRTRRARP